MSVTMFEAALRSRPERAGPMPRMTPSNPQEQREQFPERWSLIEALADFAFALEGVEERETRIAPPGSRALTLPLSRASPNSEAFMVDLEFAHIHNPPIGSLHLTLPRPVRDLAVLKGWALRHPLAVQGVVSPDVVFVFAPRNDEELETVKLLLRASHAHALRTENTE
jgi:hypothetical protein